jgi:hypothetical protein
MSDLDEKMKQAVSIYNMIVFLENGINKDSTDNKNKLIENHEDINNIIEIYNELLDTSVFSNINLHPEILNYYNEGKRILTEIETKMIEYTPKLSENEILLKHGVELHDNKEETQEITLDTTDPITLDEISDGQTIAYLIDEENKNKKFPPPPPFIYDEKNMYGIRKLILSSKIPEKPPKNPITRAIIKEVYLYKAKVPNSEESGKKGGRRKTNKRRGKTNKKRGKTMKKRVKNNNNNIKKKQKCIL